MLHIPVTLSHGVLTGHPIDTVADEFEWDYCIRRQRAAIGITDGGTPPRGLKSHAEIWKFPFRDYQ